MAEIDSRSNFLNSLPQDLQNSDQNLVEHFKNRRNFIEVLESKLRTWKINQAGINVPAESLIEVEMINEITPELLQSDDWKNSQFKPFDVTLESATPRTGRSHPMQALIERIRHIFLEMGFSELKEDYVQTAGWNMDALFIPQDHPAREMQDTFYLDNPKQMELPEELMQTWSKIHKDVARPLSVGRGVF